jgi:CheY-like chemotaxis protein
MTNQNITSKPLALVAEDDQVSFFYQKSILNEMGFTVIHAVNGKLAVELVQQNPSVSIVLMDIHMPLLDGIEATRQMKQLPSPPPVLIVSAYDTAEIQTSADLAGCDGYILKPIAKQQLIHAVKPFLFPDMVGTVPDTPPSNPLITTH